MEEEEEASGSVLAALANQCDGGVFKPVARTAGLSGNIIISSLRKNQSGRIAESE
jgi:hypothetical protein